MDISEDILRVAFRLPPEKAQKYLEKKGYTFSFSWSDVQSETHAHAFTVAKVMRRDVLGSIREMTERAVREGITFDKFQKSLEPYLKLAGWWGRTWPQDDEGRYLDGEGKPWPVDDAGTPQIPKDAKPPLLGSPYRLQTIYRQNLQTALNVGRYQGQIEVADKRPYWAYYSVLDNRTGSLCRRLDGVVYRHDDPFWQMYYPPNHWRCRARVGTLSERELAREGLTVSESNGAISVELGPRGLPIATIKIGDEKFSTNEGFAYNPGRAALTPFLPRYAGAAFSQLGTPSTSTTESAAERMTTRKALGYTPAQTKGWTDDDYASAFLRELGITNSDGDVLTNAAGDPVPLAKSMWAKPDGTISVPPSLRPHIRELADTVKSPSEIWLVWVERDGKRELAERYIGRYQSGKKDANVVTVDIARDGWHPAVTPDAKGTVSKSGDYLLYYESKR